MVIRGEKAPAFSATTLKLPAEQIDNTGRIIEYSRRHYSRPRAEVEAEIDMLIRSTTGKNMAPTQKQPNATSASAIPATLPGQTSPTPQTRTPQPATSIPTPAQARLWPIDAGARAVESVAFFTTNETQQSGQETSAPALTSTPTSAQAQPQDQIQNQEVATIDAAITAANAAPVKKKRRRRRRSKKPTDASTADKLPQ
jgi:hypothetical protein